MSSSEIVVIGNGLSLPSEGGKKKQKKKDFNKKKKQKKKHTLSQNHSRSARLVV